MKNLEYIFFRTFLIFGVKINIYANDIINIDFLKMYEDKNDKEVLYEKNIYCVKNSDILNEYLNYFDINNAQIIKSYVKSYYYEIDSIFIRDNLSHIVEKKGNNIFFIYDFKLENKENKLWCIIREIIHRNTEERGGIMLHSAALYSKNQNNILILGEKGAGKTTLLTTLLEFNDYLFSSNERVLIRKEDEKALSIHYPIRLGIRNILNNERLYKYVKNNYCKLKKEQTVSLEMLEEYKKNKSLEEQSLFKIEFDVKEFIDCFNVEYKSILKPKIVLLPKISSEMRGYKIEVLKKNDIIKAIQKQCYTPYDKTWLEPWIEKRKIDNEILVTNAFKFIRKISNYLIGIRIEYGYDFYELLKHSERNFFKNQIEDIYNKRTN